MSAPSDRDSELDALIAIYTSDRQDGNNMIIVSMTALGFGLSYVSLSIPATDNLSGDQLGWLLAVLPVPVLVVLAFHSIFLAAGVARARSVARLQDRLKADAGVRLDEAQEGARAVEHLMNAASPAASLGAKATLLVAYAGAAFVAIGFVVACHVQAIGSAHPALWIVSGVLYLGALTAIGSNYLSALSVADEPDLADVPNSE